MMITTATEEKKKKKVRINYRTNQNIKNNNKCFLRSQLSASSPHWFTAHLCLPRDPPIPAWVLYMCVLISGPVVGFSSDSNLALTLSVLVSNVHSCQGECFLLWEYSFSFYIFHWHRVYLVDRVNLTSSLYSWWKCFQSPSLATLPADLIVVWSPPLLMGHAQESAPEAAPGESLSLLPWRPRGDVVRLLGCAWTPRHQVCREASG